ncbi:Rtf2 RING-finger-domain-containing protein [Epithele typhae]|uniref:Rtf2 RING-finger-domain-containing protein n=1 Tax=Epithele typhae TaxID=378194 RepID=UPI002007B916|nr:Rtf2 RING-finger-domain-containing protein [Epithele typhae]KAH9939040.1 Rtf2 RING-finger-domain-containing protein [Epithele typhae]
MGNDGGSIPDRRDLVRSKPKAEQADRANQVRAMWFFCALSKRPLQQPIVSCPLGKLYIKDAILEFLLDRNHFGAEGEIVCGHIRSMKDVKTLKLTPNAAKTSSAGTAESAHQHAAYVCPLNFKEMNGVQPFVYLAPCGCVFSQAGLRAKEKEKAEVLDLCPNCGTKYARSADVVVLNPGPELELEVRTRMEAKRLLEPAKGKGKGKKRKAEAAEAAEAEPPAKKATNPSIAAASRGVTQELAKEEAKRKAGMSEAVKSLYASKDGPQRKETFMTMGTFTRYA